MAVINRYIVNQQNYITKKMQQPLIGFTNPQGEQAQWDDIAVNFTNAGGITQNIYFNNLNKVSPKFNSTFTEDDRLSQESHQLLFSYTLDVLKENVSTNNKKGKQAIARRFLAHLNQNIAFMSTVEIQRVIEEMNNTQFLTTFFEWLNKHKMIPSLCNPNIPQTSKGSTRTKSGDDAIKAEKSKLPDEKSLLALCAIFHDVIPAYKNDDSSDTTNWDSLTHPTLKQRGVFTCTMSALAMASPNRVAAEQVLLSKQRLKSITEVVNGKDETVYFLNWRGSKGYLDNQKHFNREMAESLDRALHLMGLVTEPARVLARFYKEPKLPLKSVLGEFSPSEDNLSRLNSSMSKPTSLINLGLLLGFFDGTNKTVRVTQDTEGAIALQTSRRRKLKYVKSIADLSPFDKLVLIAGCPLTEQLIGSRYQGNMSSLLNDDNSLTVADFQNYYVSLNKDRLKGLNQGQAKKVNYADALFTFTERQMNNQVCGSSFSLVAISSLENHFANHLKKFGTKKTIFEQHGFSSEFGINPHQFRHWQNDYLAKQRLPHLLISLLSGRKSPEQTLQYIHTTDAQKASVIADIMFDSESDDDVQDNIKNRLQKKEQYDIAIENLSPTFVTEVGFCAQNLTLSPCTYMNDFESQCTLCSSSCHVAHDEDAICQLRDDLNVQTKRLEMVQGALDFTSSKGKQEWYVTHYKNTCMLKKLIDVMSDEKTKEGSIIRILSRSNIMRVTNLETQIVEQRTLSLPNTEEALKAAIEAKTRPSEEFNAKDNFLGFLSSI
ncbi:hypothetical protein FR932_09930 [Moritella marina ATCC 15381]|uniref:Integrase n=1 Tax=Moritella marina ATCC 15381 TaxID=1202962 RepID=A0A5J6WIY5_MORMI|nr:hypothetical protein [Moritella marina]QFI38139.1 hypothetical protein FR932_09930 [Moritella marina ATCC 15381]